MGLGPEHLELPFDPTAVLVPRVVVGAPTCREPTPRLEGQAAPHPSPMIHTPTTYPMVYLEG